MMKPRKILTICLIGLIFASLAVVVSADDPPKSNNSAPSEKVHLGVGSSGPTQLSLDATQATITELELTEDNQLTPAAPPQAETVTFREGFEPRQIIRAKTVGSDIVPVDENSAVPAEQLFRPSAVQQPDSDSGVQQPYQINTSTLTSQNFEGTFPGEWELDPPSGGPTWGAVNCFALSGNAAGWPAASSRNPCGGQNYLNNMNSWMVYGPFSLADVQAASLDFFFRIDSEFTGNLNTSDRLFWGASTNGNNFFGSSISGDFKYGPFTNGYNFESIDLSDVSGLGNLIGQPEVWIGFSFISNSSVTDQGAFIDDIFLTTSETGYSSLVNESFDVNDFPNQSWLSFDNDGLTNGEYLWDDVDSNDNTNDCPSRSGDWSMWAADEGANGLDPCSGDQYPPNAKSWLVYGPFNLSGAIDAWVDFHFRIESESGADNLAWMASTDNIQYNGFQISGTFNQGIQRGGYNHIRLYFDSIPELAGWRNQSAIWLAFTFNSDSDSLVGEGPFIDDVKITVETGTLVPSPGITTVYLPVVVRSEPQPTTGQLTFRNETGNPVIVELVGLQTKQFSAGVGPHNWDGLPAGTYDWKASGTCPQGQGQVGSTFDPSSSNFRAPVTIKVNQTTQLNQERNGVFGCNG